MNNNRFIIEDYNAHIIRKQRLHKKREKKLEPGQKAGFTVVPEATPDWLKAFSEEIENLGPLSKPQKLNMDG